MEWLLAGDKCADCGHGRCADDCLWLDGRRDVNGRRVPLVSLSKPAAPWAEEDQHYYEDDLQDFESEADERGSESDNNEFEELLARNRESSFLNLTLRYTFSSISFLVRIATLALRPSVRRGLTRIEWTCVSSSESRYELNHHDADISCSIVEPRFTMVMQSLSQVLQKRLKTI